METCQPQAVLHRLAHRDDLSLRKAYMGTGPFRAEQCGGGWFSPPKNRQNLPIDTAAAFGERRIIMSQKQFSLTHGALRTEHNPRVIMLFGDGHEQSYRFPTKPETDPLWAVPPNPTNQWW